MEKSFQLIRTNPRLTSNIKLVVDSSYNLYFESFDSSKELSNQQYKHYLLNREAVLENEIPKFYNKLPKNLAFTPKTQSDADVMYNKYIQQFDNTYYAGANEVEDQWYKEEFEYFSPLYIKRGLIPKKFIILRVDEPAIYKIVGDDYVMGELSKDNFRSEIIDKWKCVTTFDLSNTTNVGKFFDRNINNNNRFPEFSFFFDTKKYNYSKWGGLEYESGVYKVSEMFLDDKLFYENPHFNFEEFITKGFEDNGLIYPYILNMKFLFDDTPASPDEYKKWSMNRYFGFYAEDFELVKNITTAELPKLKEGLTIKNNIFLSGTTYVNPYIIEYTDNQWIQVGSDFYEVKLQSNGSYKIIADKNLTGYDVSTFNSTSSCQIKPTGDNRNEVVGIDVIDKYLNTDGVEKDMYADIYLIQIFGQYHILKKDLNGYYIQTDYAIESDNKILRYWKGGSNSELSGLTSVINENGSPLSYSIYRVKLTDIKDFDFDRISTHYSDFDYEKSEYVDTKEVKLYANEYRDMSIPVRKKTHDKGEDGEYKIKNIASEYTAGDETFELRNDAITPIFEKNQSICKWSYEGSISHSDYPYKLNNSLTNGGSYNRTTNTELKITSIEEKTLDYFYRIGELYGKNIDPLIDNFSSTLWEKTGTTVPFDGEWEFHTTNAFADSENSGTTYAKLKAQMIKNELYDITIHIDTISALYDPNAPFEVGLAPTSFYGGTSTDSGATDIIIKFVGRALSNELRLMVTNAALYFRSISMTQIVDKHYLNQSTNIQTKLQRKFDLNSVNVFNLEHYINSDFDYFDFFFKNDMYYENFGRKYTKPYQKYSMFGGGDSDLPSTTLFKGIEYRLYTVEDMVLNQQVGGEETIRNIITKGGQKYNSYKFAVILNENYDLYSFDFDGTSYSNPISLGLVNNSVYYGKKTLIKANKEGIHVFLNDKYKNVVIIINKIIPINSEWGSLNNVDKFGENYGLYYGKTLDGFDLYPTSGTISHKYDPNRLTAAYYMESLNNMNTKSAYENYVSYYYIDADGRYAQTEMIKFTSDSPDSGFTELPNWNSKFPLFYIETSVPDTINMKKKSYVVTPLKGPETNIYDKYLVYSNNRPLNESYIDEPLSRKIDKYEVDETKNTIVHGETITNTNTINRYIGYYEPIFKNLSIFKPTYYWVSGTTYYSILGNYVFDDTLDQFGVVEEIMYSKVNEYDNYLKLKNSDTERSYYPMVDEIGLSQTSRFIFLSPWDRNFYIKTLNQQTLLQDYVAIPIQTITLPSSAKILSSKVYKSTAPTVELTNGIKLEGKNLSGDAKLQYTVSTVNLSANAKEFNMYMRYQSDTGRFIDMGIVGSTSQVFPGQTWTFTTSPLSRPDESTSNEYSLWTVYFECHDASNDAIIDTKTFTNFNIYNNLIHFNITNPSYTSSSHVTGAYYGFSAMLNESVGVLSNIPYTAEIHIKKYGSSDYVKMATVTGLITSNTSLGFTNVLLDRVSLNWPWYMSDTNTSVKYVAYHTYDIEGVPTTSQTSGLTTRTDYSITSEIKPFNLVWESTSPTISKTAGGCSGGSYAGDKFTVNGMTIRNTGGPFNGTITLTSQLYRNETPINVMTEILFTTGFSEMTVPPTVTRNNVDLGKYYTDGSTILTTKTTENYKVRTIATYKIGTNAPVTIMNGSLGYKDSAITPGCIPATNLVWDSTPPTITRYQGSCSEGVYSGDYFSVNNLIIRNTGDNLSNGSIVFTVNIYENNGSTWSQVPIYQTVVNPTGVNINTCGAYTYASITAGLNKNYVTSSTKIYKAIISASNVLGTTETSGVYGFNDSSFNNCKVTPTFSISSSANTVCAGTNVTFTAGSIANGGSSPSFQWKRNGSDVGTNSNTYTYPPTNGDVISCVMTSSLGYASPKTATSNNTITMTVNPTLTPSVTITSTATSISVGTSVTFSISASSNLGGSPSYQWTKDGGNIGGANSSTYTTTTLANGNVIGLTVTSNATCASPATVSSTNTITMTVISDPSFSWTNDQFTISATSQGSCSGGPVAFSMPSGPGEMILGAAATYSGDVFSVPAGNIKINNTGSAFTGNLVFTFFLYEDGILYSPLVKTIVTEAVTSQTGVYTLADPVTLTRSNFYSFTNKQYTYQVSVAASTYSVPSAKSSYNSVAGYCAPGFICSSAPTAPVAIAATNVRYNGFTANWNAVTDATSYLLDVDGILSGQVVNSTSYGVIGLEESTTYSYQVRAVGPGGTSAYSNLINVTTASCLDENTLIKMSDGTTKAIKYLNVGEEVISYDVNGSKETFDWSGNTLPISGFTKSIVISVKKAYQKGFYVINNSLKATPFHVMLVKDNTNVWKWTAIKDIKVGDKLFKDDGTEVNVDSNIYLDVYINTIKLDVEEIDNFFAGGVLNHNIKAKV